MRKYSKFLALVLCASMAFHFTGCGSSKDSKEKESSSSESKKDDDNEEEKYVREADIYKDLDFSKYVTTGDYASIELSKKDIDDKTDTMVQTNIERTDSYKKDKKSKIKEGDTVNIFYVGKMDGKEFNGGSCTKENTPDGHNLKIGSDDFIEGFEDGLIGKKPGKTYDVKAKFPEVYQLNPDYAGKEAIFTVTVNYILDWPELSDNFVESNFKDFDENYENNAKDYTRYIRDNVVKDMAWEYVYTKSDIKEYPEDLLERVKTQYRTPIIYYLKQNGTNLEDYLSTQSMTEEDFEKNVEISAKSDLGKRLVFNAIAQKEDIGLDEDAYKEVLESYLKEYAVEDQKELDKLFDEYFGTKSEDIINNEILYESVNKFLTGKVKETA
ncbi:MAG: hypothetical protein HFH68_02920 [Lachnospiraceae bacterium]|nr:hypothetical protein [Lachnospiraceae bacterium]